MTTTARNGATTDDPAELARLRMGLPPTLSKLEAAALGKVSGRTIERMVGSGLLLARRRLRSGSSPVVLITTDVLRAFGLVQEVGA